VNKPLIDLESHVPRAITVVRRSQGWPGIFLQERRGELGEVNYQGGLRQHAVYCFTRPLRGMITSGGTTRAVHYAAGEGRFTPAGRPMAFRWLNKAQVLIFGFEPWFFQRVAAELGGSAVFPPEAHNWKIPAGDPISALLLQLEGELDAPAGASAIAEGIARAMAVRLLREFRLLPERKPAEPAPPVAVLRAVELMRSRLAESLSLDELAQAAGLSPFHFARQFKVATGHPPHEYLIRLRVDRAQELLRKKARTWTMAAIARECGFSDQSHLARHFKRVLGVTPGDYVG
jgi:AraC family transcriptional regulator